MGTWSFDWSYYTYYNCFAVALILILKYFKNQNHYKSHFSFIIMGKRGEFLFKNKKAQFYLISAIIICAVIIGIALVKNYAYSTEEPREFYDVSSQIKDESARVIDYGVLNQDKLEEFSGNVTSNYAGIDPNMELILIYGNSTNLTVINFGNQTAQVSGAAIPGALEDVESKIEVQVGTEVFNKTQQVNKRIFTNQWTYNFNPYGNNVVIRVYDENYDFKLYEHQQFFMIIKKSLKGENYVEVK